MGVGAAPPGHDVGDVGDARAEDERQPGGLDRLDVGLGQHPRIRDHHDVSEAVSGHERGEIVGSMVLVSAIDTTNSIF